MSEFMQLINGSSKRACIDEKLINRRIVGLRDTQVFVKTLRDDIARTNRWLPAVELGLILAVATSMIADVLVDAVGPMAEKEAPLVLKPVNWVYEKARKYKFDHASNRFSKHFEQIEKVLGVVKLALPKNTEGEQIGLTLNVFASLAKNGCLLITAMEDSQDAQESTLKSLDELDRTLQSLNSKLSNLGAWRVIGQGGRESGERMSRMPPPLRLP